MRLNLVFYAEGGKMPVDYRPYIMSYIKSSLQSTYNDIFDEQYNKDLTKSKSFTLAVVFKDSKISGDEIVFNDEHLSVIFSSFDTSLLLYLYNSFIKKRNVTKRFNKNFAIQLKRLYMVPLKTIEADSVTIKFLSPLLVRQHDRETNKDRYLTFRDPGFDEQLNMCVKNLIEQNNIDYRKEISVKLIPVNAKTALVKNMGLIFNASLGEYTLSGDRQLLNILHKGGLGSRRGQGFGMFYVKGDNS
jgi:CRISPR-associated endoribonuclease Cas6